MHEFQDCTGWIRFICDHCKASLEARTRAIGTERRCPRCSETIRVPLRIQPLPVTKPGLSQADYLSQASVILELTTENCTACRRARDRERFRICKKDGKRAIGVLHSLIWQMATDAPQSQRDGAAVALARIAASHVDRLPGVDSPKKSRKVYREWLTQQTQDENMSTCQSALDYLKECKQQIRDLKFRESTEQTSQEC